MYVCLCVVCMFVCKFVCICMCVCLCYCTCVRMKQLNSILSIYFPCLRKPTPVWEETIVFNSLDLSSVDHSLMLFFEVLDFSSVKRGDSLGWHSVAWAFLKVCSSTVHALDPNLFPVQMNMYIHPRLQIFVWINIWFAHTGTHTNRYTRMYTCPQTHTSTHTHD